jgi:hypothetical protein
MNKYFILLLTLLIIPFTSALTSGEGTIIFGSIFSMSIIILFFLVLSIIINNGPMKVFFMSMSFLTILASVGMGVSVMQEFFSSLTNIVEAYGQFYILLVILTAAGLFALIVWLVIVAVKSFNSYRGLIDDD